MNNRGTATKKTDPKAFALILAVIVLIAGAVVLRVHANRERLDVPNFRAMTTAPDGRVFIVIGDDLYVEDGKGKSLLVMPLARLGVRNPYGDLAVLEDGSVILAQGRLGDVGIDEGVRMYARARPAAGDPVEGLQRCVLESGECTALAGSGNPVDVRRAFSIDVDEAAGRIYLSDPANHRLVMTDMNGEQLAVSGENWIFPNGVIRVNATTVGFADTNRHRYVELAVDANGFGEIVTDESILGWPDISALHRFPFEVLIDDTGALWMLVAGSDMADAWLYRRDANGDAYRIALPEKADPVALTRGGDRVLVADARHFTIHAFDHSGNAVDAFGSDTLKGKLAAYREVHARYQAVTDYSLLAVLVLAVPALIAGVILQSRAQRVETVEPVEATAGIDAPALLASNPQAQLSQLRGEYIFWRKYGALGTKEANRFITLLVLLMLVMTAMIVLLATMRAGRDGVSLTDTIDLDLRDYLLVLIGAGMLGFHWLSGMFERLVVNAEGIRYRSFLSGPLRFLNTLHPDWFMAWRDVSEIRLVQRGDGRNAVQWLYELAPHSGRSRRLRPLFWRLAGEEETGIALSDVFGRRQEKFRAAIHRTVLYRLLAARRAAATDSSSSSSHVPRVAREREREQA